MITEDYVSFEIAKLLKEKGFEGVVNAYYHIWDNGKRVCSVQEFSHSEAPHLYIPAPTIQMAMKWLRDNNGIAVIPTLSSILDNEKFLWDIKIVVAKTGESYSQGWIYESYEHACDVAIESCLKHLI